jgi:hypothetical protein
MQAYVNGVNFWHYMDNKQIRKFTRNVTIVARSLAFV